MIPDLMSSSRESTTSKIGFRLAKSSSYTVRVSRPTPSSHIYLPTRETAPKQSNFFSLVEISDRLVGLMPAISHVICGHSVKLNDGALR